MNQRRLYKSQDIRKYKKINNEIRKEARQTNERYLEEKCKEIEENSKANRICLNYTKELKNLQAYNKNFLKLFLSGR